MSGASGTLSFEMPVQRATASNSLVLMVQSGPLGDLPEFSK